MNKVYLNSNDISKYVLAIPEVESSIGEFGQLSVTDLPSLTGINTVGFWDQTNQASPFYGTKYLSDYKIDIYNDSNHVFQGSIQGIQCNNQTKTAEVTLKSTIRKQLDLGCIYASSANMNPATMVQEICVLYKIPYDASSFGRASAIYNTDSVVTTAFFRGEGSVQDAIQQIIEVGMARIYNFNNRLYFDIFRKRSVDAVFVASDKVTNAQGCTLYSHPTITTVEKEQLKGYKIEYVGGADALAAVFGTDIDKGKTINGTYSSPVRIMNLQSAVWIGEKWLEYYGYKQQLVEFTIPAKYGKSLQLGYPVRVEYRGRTIDIDIMKINNSMRLETRIGGLTR